MAPEHAKPPPRQQGPEPLSGPSVGRTVVLACEMIDDEILSAVAGAPEGAEPPTIVWVQSGLHEVPVKLRDHLQGLIDLLDEGAALGKSVEVPSVAPGRGDASDRMEPVTVPPCEQVLLGLGYCGNGLEGLVSKKVSLVFPRVDDCISLFLNHGCTREAIERDARAFYLTGGWLSHDNPVQQGHDAMAARFGPERAAELTRSSMASYERITLIETGAYDVPTFKPRSEEFAALLGLEHTTVPGSTQLLHKLFYGPWDGEVVVVPPGQPISIWHLFEPRDTSAE